jgi:hypothetical protein
MVILNYINLEDDLGKQNIANAMHKYAISEKIQS